MAGDDEVGYKRPPKSTQFRKGKSGNPRGRPKGTRNLRTDLAEELDSRITLTVLGKTKTLSKQQAFVKATLTNAIKGDIRAAALVLKMIQQHEPHLVDEGTNTQFAKADEDIIARFLERQVKPKEGDDK